jgi:hypothetical protein
MRKIVMIWVFALAGSVCLIGCADEPDPNDAVTQKTSALAAGIGLGANCTEACANARDDLASHCGGYAEVTGEGCGTFGDGRMACRSEGNCVYPLQ